MTARAVLICPGRGTYNAPELGSLMRHFPDPDLLARFDAHRKAAGQETLAVLDTAKRFAPKRHTTGDNASALIFAAGYGDAQALDPNKVELVAITGNSMGWYTALAAAGAVDPLTGFEIANTMGTLIHAHAPGGQLVYPHMGDEWIPDPGGRARLLAIVTEIDALPDHRLTLSIDLGGLLVLAGDSAGLRAFEAAVPPQGRFPMRLANHAAFHSDLMTPISLRGLDRFGTERFGNPDTPLIDGQGQIWWPHTTDAEALRHYTLASQVTEIYDFTQAIRIAAREFAPDLFIVAGPGTTLGGAVAQSLILSGYKNLNDKAAFQTAQSESPLLIAMGRDDQRALVA